ncbi:MAG: leucine-rich repeat domain-containing protein, partial [Paludibacteraceae bacterium]
GNEVQEIGAWAFYNCHNLSQITIPEGVEEIGTAAFFDCVYLTELTIPSTMKKIADNGFAACRKLNTMYVNALVPPTIEAKTFEEVDRATPVFVPRGTLELYQADQYWSEFFNMAEYDAPTGNLTPAADEATTLRKVLRNGQVLILRGDKTYTVLGEAL